MIIGGLGLCNEESFKYDPFKSKDYHKYQLGFFPDSYETEKKYVQSYKQMN